MTLKIPSSYLLTDGSAAPHEHCQVSGHVLVSPAATLPSACSDPRFGYESSPQLQSGPLPSGARQLYSTPPAELRLPSDPEMHIVI